MLISLRGITKIYRVGVETVHALRGVDLDIGASQRQVESRPQGVRLGRLALTLQAGNESAQAPDIIRVLQRP